MDFVTINGRAEALEGIDPNRTLLWFLRERGLTAAKEGCAEGECGACAVVLVRRDERGRARYEAVNSCLMLAAATAGQEIVTVESMADGERLHPVQQLLVDHGGSQCGYCTPGFVASMFAELYRPERDGYDPESIGGNLCRCTGYRPIRDAVRSLPLAPDDRFGARLGEAPPRLGSVKCGGFHRPASLAELFATLREHPTARLVQGGTDVVVEVNQRHTRFETIVSLEGLEALRLWRDEGDALEIGAGLPLTEIERRLHGLSEPGLPIFHELFALFSSRLIRNRATLGGNLVNASPIGDGPPTLLALGAELRLASDAGERVVPLDGFFTGYRQTLLKAGEVVISVRIPKPFPATARFYKVSKRELDDISTVAAAFAIDREGATVRRAAIAYGGVAATPVRMHAAEQALVGQPWNAASVARATEIIESALSPIDDHRGSAAYRRAMVRRLFEKFHHDTAEASP
jgi:xanthine dehydrogenase small subunit